MARPALQPLEPRTMRTFAPADVLDPFDLTTGDWVDRITDTGLYSGILPDGGGVTLLYVAELNHLTLPIGLTVAVDHLVMGAGSSLVLDHAAVIAADTEIDPAAAVTPWEGETLVTAPAATIGPVFRDVPVPAGAVVFVATDPGDANLDGNVDRDDLAYVDRYHLPAGDVIAGLFGPVCPWATAPNPVVTHLEVA